MRGLLGVASFGSRCLIVGLHVVLELLLGHLVSLINFSDLILKTFEEFFELWLGDVRLLAADVRAISVESILPGFIVVSPSLDEVIDGLSDWVVFG